MGQESMTKSRHLIEKIARILDECQHSFAVHGRKLLEMNFLFSSSDDFFDCWIKALSPLFLALKRAPSTERLIRFVAIFSVSRTEGSGAFLENFLHFLFNSSGSTFKSVRFRSCQILSEILMQLPDDTEVSDDVLDEMVECMKRRVHDRIPIVRAFAVRSLARLAVDSENDGVVELFRSSLATESNAEVRKMLVLSMPPSNATCSNIIERTLDSSESVRKTSYYVLANKFPIQTLSIKQRTIILERGLTDRASSVAKECVKLMKDSWLMKCCDGDPITLLKYLDVETYESVGEAVMDELLKSGMVNVQDDQSIRNFVVLDSKEDEDQSATSIHLMEPEVALYWRKLCGHLQTEAERKGCDAAGTTGTEAVVYAAEASDKNELLERILPATVSDFIELVKAHLVAGKLLTVAQKEHTGTNPLPCFLCLSIYLPSPVTYLLFKDVGVSILSFHAASNILNILSGTAYRFSTRQLLLLGSVLDFSDATNRRIAGEFVQELLNMPLEHEIDEEDGSKVIIGDGISLGGDRLWAKAVAEFSSKIHASRGEFEEVVVTVIEQLALPCRERHADFMQWMHCLSVVGLLLENIKSLLCLEGRAIRSSELLQTFLLPAAKHVHVDVQRASLRCLGLFGLLERKPNREIVKQLRLSFVTGPISVAIMTAKALFDLAMWHGPEEIDKAMGLDSLGHVAGEGDDAENSADDGISRKGIIKLLYSRLETDDDSDECTDDDDQETVRGVVAEGFAKILLQSKSYPGLPASMHPSILCKLITLYFSEETTQLLRLRQCLFLFFEQYAALSAYHKRTISDAYVPIMRSLWPGVFGNSGGASTVVSNRRKRATQVSLFMLHMIQIPLYRFQAEKESDNYSEKSGGSPRHNQYDIDSGEEGLAIRLSVEVLNFPTKRSPAGKSYILALCKIIVLLQFCPSHQEAIKCMRVLLVHLIGAIPSDNQVLKGLNGMATRLKSQDADPDHLPSDEQIKNILGKLGLHELDLELAKASVNASTVRTRTVTRRRARRDSSTSSTEDEQQSVRGASMVSATPALNTARSQRASKTEAMARMTGKTLGMSTSDDESELTAVSSDEN